MSDPRRVQRMFDSIARRYDAFNTVASLGRDESWRRLTARIAAPEPVALGLDAAAGTGKLSAALAARAEQVVALDFSAPMLIRGGPDLAARGLAGRIHRLQGDILALPFPDDTFDCATIGFGLRNLADIPLGLREFRRTLKPGGRLAALDIVRPRGVVGKAAYGVGFRRVMPLVGWALSGERGAYQYLPESVERYLDPDELASAMADAGFTDVGYRGLMLGSIAVHWGVAG